MKRSLLALVPALALLLLGGQAHADPITPETLQWTYNWSPSAPAVITDTNPAAGVTFTNEPTKSAIGSSDIVATNLRVFSGSPGNAPDTLSSAKGGYSLTLALGSTDDSGTHSTSLTFTGNLSGKLSSENANVANHFGPNNVVTVSLGSFNFTVALVAYTPPGPPDQNNAGSISAHVSISTLDITGHNPTPEPSTMLLSGLGMTFLGIASWRKRRRARAAQQATLA